MRVDDEYPDLVVAGDRCDDCGADLRFLHRMGVFKLAPGQVRGVAALRGIVKFLCQDCVMAQAHLMQLPPLVLEFIAAELPDD